MPASQGTGKGRWKGCAETKQKDRYLRAAAWLDRRRTNRGATHHGWQFTARSPGPLKGCGPLVLTGWPPGCLLQEGKERDGNQGILEGFRPTTSNLPRPRVLQVGGARDSIRQLPCNCQAYWSALQAYHQSHCDLVVARSWLAYLAFPWHLVNECGSLEMAVAWRVLGGFLAVSWMALAKRAFSR